MGALLLGGVWLGLPHRGAQPSPDPDSPAAIAVVNEPSFHSEWTEERTLAKPVKTAKPRKRRATVNPPDDRIAAQTNSVQFPIKFVTDDPNIIIYWLPSDKGD